MDKETLQEIKDIGLQSAENISKEVVEDLFKIIELVIVKSENKIDDSILLFLPKIKEYVLSLVDKIKA